MAATEATTTSDDDAKSLWMLLLSAVLMAAIVDSDADVLTATGVESSPLTRMMLSSQCRLGHGCRRKC